MKWQTIETAPKDGTNVLVWDHNESFIAWWDKRERTWWRRDAIIHLYPTHWMPLPNPPEIKEL